jgi:hypothetical protein
LTRIINNRLFYFNRKGRIRELRMGHLRFLVLWI